MKKTIELWPPVAKGGSRSRHERVPGHFGWRSRAARALLLALVCVLFFTGGCGVQDNIDASFSGKPSYYLDAYVSRGKPEVHVHPVIDVGGLKVLFVPFKVVQQMDKPEMVGYSIARTFWQTWAAMNVFDQFEFFAEGGPFRRDLAVAYARARGADLVVGGYVTHIFSGGNSSDNRLAVQLEGYDVSSGLLVWSMAQSGVLPAPRTRDYILFAAKRRLPTDPMHFVASVLAGDMGAIFKELAAEEPLEDDFAQPVDAGAEAGKK